MEKEVNIMFALTLVIICIFAGALGQICWKHAMSNMATINNTGDILQFKMLFEIFTNKWVILGLILYATSTILWLGALSTLDVSFMYPLLSLGYVITAILAFVFLNEDIALLRWVGIVLVVAGCFLIVRT